MITMSQVMSNKLAAAMLLLTNMARCRQQCTPQLIAGRVEIVRSALHRANHAASLSVADALLRTMVQSIASQECACARALVGALIQPVAWIAKQVLRSISTGPVFTLAVDSTMQRQVIICAEALAAGQAAANADGLYVLPKVRADNGEHILFLQSCVMDAEEQPSRTAPLVVGVVRRSPASFDALHAHAQLWLQHPHDKWPRKCEHWVAVATWPARRPWTNTGRAEVLRGAADWQALGYEVGTHEVVTFACFESDAV